MKANKVEDWNVEGHHVEFTFTGKGECSQCPVGTTLSTSHNRFFNCECGLCHVCNDCMKEHLAEIHRASGLWHGGEGRKPRKAAFAKSGIVKV